MDIDDDGNVYVGGRTNGNLAGAVGSSDCFLRILSSNGNTLDTYQFGSPQNEGVSGVAVDANQRVYVAGQTMGGLQGPLVGSTDGFVMQLPP